MITKEKLEHHIKHLQEKHDALDKEIIEMDCHYDESIKCHNMKKQKLKLKDEIEEMKRKIQAL
jgi:uncharacterized protein YdcH (DUF465 family)